MTAQLTRLGVDYEVVDAVDGRELDLTDAETIAAIAPSFLNAEWWRPTHAACAMSHLSIYRRILADGLDAALVLEDDVTLPGDIMALAEGVARQLDGAEVALINFDSPHPCQMRRAGAMGLPSGRQLVVPADVSQPVSGAAYVITREACQRITKGALPIRAKCDDWAHFYNEGMIDRLRCVVPLAVTKNPDFGSTIGYYSDASLKARMLGIASRYQLGIFQRVVSYRRRRIWRKYTRVEFVD
jgi:glycosyl transferase family 25